jgi:hypothetical protein
MECGVHVNLGPHQKRRPCTFQGLAGPAAWQHLMLHDQSHAMLIMAVLDSTGTHVQPQANMLC